jgi:hypothetical protein
MPLPSLASDMYAFQATADSHFCKVSYHPFPFASSAWGLAATRGAHHKFHLDADGFGTHIKVINKGGCKWWVIATPRNPQALASTLLFTRNFNVDNVDVENYNFEGMLLTPGMEL